MRVADRSVTRGRTGIEYPSGTDAPICQDTRSGGLDDLLASAEIGHDALVDLASEATFQAPDDLSLGSAVRRAACDVINGRLMVPHADDDGSIEGGVGVAVAASIEAVPPVVIPDEAGIGHAPQSFAKAASERIRSGLSPKTINSSAAVWAPTPKPSRRVGDVSVVRRVRCWSCIAISSVRAIQPAGERPEGMLGGRGGRVDGARSESGAAREQAVIGEVVEGFS